jgi:type I restriction enzyme M protein
VSTEVSRVPQSTLNGEIVDNEGRKISRGGIITVPVGKVLCYITHKIRRNTPEENVRQRIARSLVQEYGYKKSDIDVEFLIKVGSAKKRIDLPIFIDGEPHLQENIYLAVETKKESLKPTDKKEGVGQLKSYMAACLNCQFGMWTNGVDMLCFQKVQGKDKFLINDVIDIPPRGKSADEFEKPTFEMLRPATDLRAVFKRCHNYIYGNQGLPKDKAFHELLKLIFSKVRDERESKVVGFYVTNKELHSTTGSIKVQNRIDELFKEVEKQYPHIFSDPSEKLDLDPNVLAYVVSQVQPYSFLETDTDVKGAAYEEIVGANLRGDRGEFFTPRNVCRLAVEILFASTPGDKWKELRIIDPACGTGGFLIAILNHIKAIFYREELAKWHDEETASTRTNERIKSYCEHSLFGIDINPLLVRATQMNEVMHGNGSGNLFCVNSLRPPPEWPQPVLQRAKLESFDLLFTNPPFGAKIPIDDPHILAQYDLGHIWKDNGNFQFVRTDELRGSVAPEQLFIERCVQMLKEHGRMAIVLPDSILSNPGLAFIRYWILTNTRILASVDLPPETFEPFVGTQASLLFLERKSDDEIRYEKQSGVQVEYDIFMSVPKKIGHDRRGNAIFQRTPDGEEIIAEMDREITKIVRGKKVKERIKSLETLRADDLPFVAEEFRKWWQAKDA